MLELLFVALLQQPALTAIVPPDTPFEITWEQPVETPMPAYRFWCNGVILKNFTNAEIASAPSESAGMVTITTNAPGLKAGTYTCLVSAFNSVGETKSESVPILVGTMPGTPIKLRIVVKVGGND